MPTTWYELPLYSFCILNAPRGDAVFDALRAFAAAGNAVETAQAYCRLAGNLAAGETTLADYLYNLALYDDNAYMRAFAAHKAVSDALISAFEHDAAMLGRLAALTPSILKADMAARFPDATDFCSALPDFEAGEWRHEPDEFGAFAAKNGFGRFASHRAFVFDAQRGLRPVSRHDPVRLSDLKGYALQRDRVVDNTRCFLEGKPANNVLLYGDRGTGKSSTVKALLNEFGNEGLRMVQIGKESLSELGALIEQIGDVPLKFILFIDDLTFNQDDDSFGALKAVLEGSLVSRPSNMLIYATTNLRHLIKETFSSREGDEVHRADAIDETLSLSDRFGLFITFTMPNKDVFLDIVCALADDRGLVVDAAALRAGAERFALAKAGRTPRLAKQYIDYVAPRIERGLSL